MVKRTGFFSPNFTSPPTSGPKPGDNETTPHFHSVPHNGSYTVKDFPCWSKECDAKDEKPAAGLTSVKSSKATCTLSWLLEDEKFSFGIY